jgi:NAD(P)-dependent dehydrogenase (short-subunit alcohol dehydrogenase family)
MTDDKNAVVTGASKGIGLAVAAALRDERADRRTHLGSCPASVPPGRRD